MVIRISLRFFVLTCFFSVINCVSKSSQNKSEVSPPLPPKEEASFEWESSEALRLYENFNEEYDIAQEQERQAMSRLLTDRPDNLSNEIAKGWLQGLAKEFAPIIYMNDGQYNQYYREPYLLADIKNYLKYVGVKYVDPKTNKSTICIEPGEIKPDFSNLYNFTCGGIFFEGRKYNGNLQMFIPMQNRQAILKGGMGKCYVSAKFIDPSRSVESNISLPANHTSGYAEVSYIFWYPYNGNPVSANYLKRKLFEQIKAGHHEGDLEHMTVRLSFDPRLAVKNTEISKDKIKIEGVHYAAHASNESVWYKHPAKKPDDLSAAQGYKLIDGRLIGFAASQTHATYNRIPEPIRFSNNPLKVSAKLQWIGTTHLLPSEKTAKGMEADCQDRLVFLPTAETEWVGEFAWLNFPGLWGANPGGKASVTGPSNLPFKKWYFMEAGFED